MIDGLRRLIFFVIGFFSFSCFRIVGRMFIVLVVVCECVIGMFGLMMISGILSNLL